MQRTFFLSECIYLRPLQSLLFGIRLLRIFLSKGVVVRQYHMSIYSDQKSPDRNLPPNILNMRLHRVVLGQRKHRVQRACVWFYQGAVVFFGWLF